MPAGIFRAIKTEVTVFTIVLALISCHSDNGSAEDRFENIFATLRGEDGLSPALDVFTVDGQRHYDIDGRDYVIGAGFQPSVLLDPAGTLHIFFQLTGSWINCPLGKIEFYRGV